jgi:NAD(P)-dependent dehydrogenase (short-subunit alcohol dehydrogenase family)
LDVTDFAAIGPVVAQAERDVGPIDVLVNSAGYGHEGTLEESPLDEMKRQFDVNVFGAVAMIKAVLPFMRERRRGHIINITSMAGYVGLPGIPYYAGSKFALEGISEVLANEVRGFGIKVTAVAPGSFRTDWAGRSMIRSPRSIAVYYLLFDPPPTGSSRQKRPAGRRSGQSRSCDSESGGNQRSTNASAARQRRTEIGPRQVEFAREGDRHMGIGHEINRVRVGGVTTLSAYRHGSQHNFFNRSAS